MVFSEKIFFTGDGVTDEIVSDLKGSKDVFNIYLICSEKNSHNLFEILSSHEALKNHNLNKNYTVIGIARGKEAAFFLLKDIIENFFKKGISPQELKSVIHMRGL